MCTPYTAGRKSAKARLLMHAKESGAPRKALAICSLALRDADARQGWSVRGTESKLLLNATSVTPSLDARSHLQALRRRLLRHAASQLPAGAVPIGALPHAACLGLLPWRLQALAQRYSTLHARCPVHGEGAGQRGLPHRLLQPRRWRLQAGAACCSSCLGLVTAGRPGWCSSVRCSRLWRHCQPGTSHAVDLLRCGAK